MTAIIAKNAIQPPEHPEHQPWLVVWVARNGDAIFADSLSDIVGVIIEGYDELDDGHEDDLHLQARLDVLATLAASAQALVLADLAARGIQLSEPELTAALLDKQQSATLTRWNPAEPLVLLTTSYEPFTDTPQPAGSVLWLDCTNEAAFLGSLNKVGEGELWLPWV